MGAPSVHHLSFNISQPPTTSALTHPLHAKQIRHTRARHGYLAEPGTPLPRRSCVGMNPRDLLLLSVQPISSARELALKRRSDEVFRLVDAQIIKLINDAPRGEFAPKIVGLVAVLTEEVTQIVQRKRCEDLGDSIRVILFAEAPETSEHD